MKTTYSVTQAQAELPRILKQAERELVAVTRHNEPVAFLVSRERMEAFLETLEILANPEAMAQITKYESGEMVFRDVEVLLDGE